jgi:hypothetical protein
MTMPPHANSLNAERLGAVADAIVRRGYRFVTLDRETYFPEGTLVW